MQEVDEVGNVHDRIVQMVDHFCKGNKAAFGRATNIQSGVLAGLIGGRKNKPSFEVVQKILTGYPSVDPTWLLFGRGPMIREGLGNSEGVSQTQGHRLTALLADEGNFKQAFEGYLDTIAPNYAHQVQKAYVELRAKNNADFELQHTYYFLSGKPFSDRPYNGLLTERLGISEEEAKELVRNGKIKSFYVGKSPRISNHRVTEEEVQKFLSGSFEHLED